MSAAIAIALDILREAIARRWFIAFALALTLINGGVLLGLRMDVVDGALAATRLFGSSLGHDIRAADVALRHVFEVATYLAFYGGLAFGVLSCSDFGPELLAPGRIEHLLSLPVRRIELLAGTFMGVMLLCLLGTAYGAGGFFLILCAKSGVWTWKPFLAMYVGTAAFVAIYAAMLAASVFVRSAALSAAVGGLVGAAGALAAERGSLAAVMEPGVGRDVALALLAPLPRVTELAELAALLAVGQPAPAGAWRLLTSALLFGVAALGIGAWRLEGRDF